MLLQKPAFLYNLGVMQNDSCCRNAVQGGDFAPCAGELNAKNLPEYFGYNIEDFERNAENCQIKPLPFSISPAYFEQMQNLYQSGKIEDFKALQRQIIPSPDEFSIKPYEISDPLGAHRYQVTERLVHQYKNRCLLISTGACFANCRHCFRRASQVRQMPFISAPQIEEVCRYLSAHTEVKEILVSGGDCLTASDKVLFNLLQKLRAVRSDLIIRIGTRAPVFAPGRFTGELLQKLSELRPLWIIPHINHPAELSAKTIGALNAIINSGIPMQSQTVLLRGVNNSLQTLTELFTRLATLGVRPGYLFQGDLAPGTAYLRTNIEESLQLYEELRKELSGLSLPVFAVDLPNGGGKFNLLQLSADFMKYTVEKKSEEYVFNGKDGETWRYPIEQ